jgi:hypothetical protein
MTGHEDPIRAEYEDEINASLKVYVATVANGADRAVAFTTHKHEVDEATRRRDEAYESMRASHGEPTA